MAGDGTERRVRERFEARLEDGPRSVCEMREDRLRTIDTEVSGPGTRRRGLVATAAPNAELNPDRATAGMGPFCGLSSAPEGAEGNSGLPLRASAERYRTSSGESGGDASETAADP